MEAGDFVSLHKNEKVVMELRQSYLSSISPGRIILTDKRAIIVHYSFWGLYMHHNLTSPTRINTVLLGNIMGTTITDGKLLATVHIRIRGSSETEGGGWHIDGLRIHKAMEFAEELEELLASKDRNSPAQGVNEIDKTLAKAMVDDGKSLLIWLGLEPPEYVAQLVKIQPGKVLRVNPIDIFSMSEDGLRDFDGKVLACYSGNVSTQVASFLKKEYKIEAFVLKGGLIGVIQGGIDGKG